MAAFNWLTALQANQEVSVRLGDPSQIFWTKDEIYQYLYETLRVYNALTAFWATPFSLTINPPFSQNWFAVNGTGSFVIPKHSSKSSPFRVPSQTASGMG